MSNRGGWLQKVLMWENTDLCLNEYNPYKLIKNKMGITLEEIEFWGKEKPWELDKNGNPNFAKLTHSHGPDGSGVESYTLCIKWDDDAKDRFYQRDWTDDGIPFVREKEIYWSGWWFRTLKERDRFLKWLPKHYKGPVGLE